MIDFYKLSKILSNALRHEPEKYNIILDKEGWVEIEQLLVSIRKNVNGFSSLEIEDIFSVINSPGKKRHELKGNLIRALYGHSANNLIYYQSIIPPNLLYHGTAPDFCRKILLEGLKPMTRQFVHLSSDFETAFNVGKRKCKNPEVVVVNSEEAYFQGIKFYFGQKNIYLSDFIPSRFLHMGIINNIDS